MMKRALALCLASACASTPATEIASSPFTEALINGEAQTPLPTDRQFAGLAEQIQKKTGDKGEVIIKAVRILKFKTQPNCGRVAFIIMQPSRNLAWSDLGGQLNICIDGQPPLRECKELPGSLFQPNHKCPNGKPAVDTAEVADAINGALRNGGFTHEQAKAATFKTQATKEKK